MPPARSRSAGPGAGRPQAQPRKPAAMPAAPGTRWLLRNADIERSYAVLGRLAEVANGNNPRRITFQRFVLATLLDEVLEALQLRLMRHEPLNSLRTAARARTGRTSVPPAGSIWRYSIMTPA
ncbi:hypothetical protein ACU4GD_04110 [Cupriavidus basilensis]